MQIGPTVSRGVAAAGAVTSGELTHRFLSTRPTPWWQQLGTKCIHLTWSSRGTISLEGLGLQVIKQPAHAADWHV
jgi:hypothetical protein